MVATLAPQRRSFTVQQMTTTEAEIQHQPGCATSTPCSARSATAGRCSACTYNPLAPWIWLGALVMAAGGLVSLADRRLRVGAPARRTRPAAAAPA